MRFQSAAISRNVLFYLGYLTVELVGEADNVRHANLTEVRDRLNQSPTIANILKGHLATIRRRDDMPLASPPTTSNDSESPRVDRSESNSYEITADPESDEEMANGDQPARRSVPARRTCVTPIVERVARKVFSAPLNLVGERLPDVTWRQSRSEGTRVPTNTTLKVD
jgi:hypothetical protein